MMRAMSLTQPWCGLMAAGLKLIENRNQPIVSPRDFGEPFGLHATRVIDDRIFPQIRQIAPELSPDFVVENNNLVAKSTWGKLSQITSAIIATAVIERVIKAIGWDTIAEKYIYDPADLEGIPREQRRFMFGRYCYVFKPSPIVLGTPVKTRGWQGFWTMPDDVEAAVRAQIAEAA